MKIPDGTPCKTQMQVGHSLRTRVVPPKYSVEGFLALSRILDILAPKVLDEGGVRSSNQFSRDPFNEIDRSYYIPLLDSA